MRQPRPNNLDPEIVGASINRVLHPRRTRPLLVARVKRVGGYADACYVVAVEVKRGPGSSIVRGSCSQTDRSRWYAAKAHDYVWRHGFDRGRHRVPKPVGYDVRTGWWWYHDAPGTPVAAIGDAARVTIARQTALALAALHRLPPPTTLRRPSSEIHRTWEGHRRMFRALSPRVRTEVGRLSRLAEALDQHFGGCSSRRLVHHDLHPQNLLWDGTSLIILDFTESRLSHPLVDVATSVIQWGLQGRARGWRNIREQQRMLWRQYRQTATRTPDHEFPDIQQYVWRRINLQRLVGAILERRPTSQILSDLRHPCPDLL